MTEKKTDRQVGRMRGVRQEISGRRMDRNRARMLKDRQKNRERMTERDSYKQRDRQLERHMGRDRHE